MEPFAIRRARVETEARSVGVPADAGRPFDEAHVRLVLLVTDDVDFRAAAERSLQQEGFRVAAAAHAGHALLACLGTNRFDVLVTELSMQDMSGPALAERVHRHYPNLPVVYVATCGTPECQGVLVRPFTRDDLLREIDLALSGATA
jgi:two-component system, NtrC family, response regulator GlrR